MRVYRKHCKPFFYAALAALTLYQNAYGIESANVQFSGTMVAQPCTLPDEKSIIDVDFGTVINKNLYYNGRSNLTPINLVLEDCDLSMDQSTVSISFNALPSTKLPGLIAIDPTSEASGVAIGLETDDGQLLPINKKSPKQTLKSGNNTIALKAYIQGEPEAVEKKSITLGEFTAIATFTLTYE